MKSCEIVAYYNFLVKWLYETRNYVKPKPGFNNQVVLELKNITSDYNDLQCYFVLLIDEMKIWSNLGFDKFSGELVGFTDLGYANINYRMSKKLMKLLWHFLSGEYQLI